jgi:hypothetical protein
MPRLRWLLLGFSAAVLTAGTLSQAQEGKVEEGYTSLFNGKDLTGWVYKSAPKESLAGKTETPDGRFSVENGVIVAHAKDTKGKGGIRDLYTAKSYGKDFILKLQFRAAPKADSGVYIRGNQLQVRDYPAAGPYKKVRFNKGDWNDLEIAVRGNVLVTKVNGKALGGKDSFELSIKGGQPTATLNGKTIPVSKVQLDYGAVAECKCNGEVIEAAFQVPAKGGIGLQAESGQFEFRNIRAKELD